MKRRHLAIIVSLLALFAASATPVKASDSTQLLTALKAMPAQADKFRAMMSNLNASQFHLVNASGVMDSADGSAYKLSLKKDASALADLRDTLSHTTVTGMDGVITPLRKVLQNKSVTIDQVIGVFVGGDGQITLFYQ